MWRHKQPYTHLCRCSSFYFQSYRTALNLTKCAIAFCMLHKYWFWLGRYFKSALSKIQVCMAYHILAATHTSFFYTNIFINWLQGSATEKVKANESFVIIHYKIHLLQCFQFYQFVRTFTNIFFCIVINSLFLWLTPGLLGCSLWHQRAIRLSISAITRTNHLLCIENETKEQMDMVIQRHSLLLSNAFNFVWITSRK